jgi:hypothetical protein
MKRHNETATPLRRRNHPRFELSARPAGAVGREGDRTPALQLTYCSQECPRAAAGT